MPNLTHVTSDETSINGSFDSDIIMIDRGSVLRVDAGSKNDLIVVNQYSFITLYLSDISTNSSSADVLLINASIEHSIIRRSSTREEDLEIMTSNGTTVIIDDFFGSYFGDHQKYLHKQLYGIVFTGNDNLHTPDISEVEAQQTYTELFTPNWNDNGLYDRYPDIWGEYIYDIVLTGSVLSDVVTGYNLSDDIVSGGGGDDKVYGKSGDDTLSGGGGDDKLWGGDGSDTYLFDANEGNFGQDILVDSSSEDQIVLNQVSGLQIKMNSQNHLVIQTDQGSISLMSGFTSSSQGNIKNSQQVDYMFVNDELYSISSIIQNTGVLIEGSGQNDTLNDSLSSYDLLIGGLGDDSYRIHQNTDQIIEYQDEGFDTVGVYFDNYTLSQHVEKGYLIDGLADVLRLTGNTLNNQLYGNNYDNILNGLQGDDLINGWSGDDQLIGASGLDHLSGGDGHDQLFGGADNDQLFGGNGNDRLDGGIGADHMTGSWGNDTYVRNNTGDVITELADQGIDTVEATISTRLGEHLEHLSLLGTNAINGTGNSLNNTLRANSADNTLDGQAGADSMIGGRGSDTYLMKRGYGQDLIIDTDSTVGNRDTISFGSNIRADQLWLSKSGFDLTFTIIGTKDSIRIKNYYQSTASQIEQFTVSSGQTLNAAKVDQLVSAMAQLTPPTLGQTSLSSQQQAILNPIFAATWA